MTIPLQTKRAHPPEGKEYLGDTLAAQNRAHRHGYKYVDQNTSVTAPDSKNPYGVPVLLHSEKLILNGFTQIWTGDYDKHGEEIRVRYKFKPGQTVSQTPWLVINRLRRPNSDLRIVSLYTALLYSLKSKVKVCYELKSPKFAAHPELAQTIVKFCKANGITAYPMTLVNMRRWGQKLKNFKLAGSETALLAHGYRKPITFIYWKRYIDRVWGHWGKTKIRNSQPG